MVLEKKNRNFIIESTLNKFRKYTFIDYNYVNNFIEAIINEEKTYDGINIVLGDLTDQENFALFVEMKLKDYLYLKVCKVAQYDSDVLVYLVEDIKNKALLVFSKMGLSDTSACEDYLIDAIADYDGLENFGSYQTKYIMAKIKGIPYVREEAPIKSKEDQALLPRRYNKKKPKKPKNKDKKKKNNAQEELSLVKELDNEYLENIPDKITDETEILEETAETGIIEEAVQELNEVIIDMTLFEENCIKEITLPKTIYDEFALEIKNIDKITNDDEDIIATNVVEQNTKEDKILDKQEIYDKCQKLIGNRKGNATKDNFIALATSVDIIESLFVNDEQFLQYLILRFSRINNSYFEIEEVGELLGIDTKTILNYEKIVIAELRKIIDNKFNDYSLLLFKKKLN